jgi:predicted  nucleic acid-binding Zn-ribbon protein
MNAFTLEPSALRDATGPTEATLAARDAFRRLRTLLAARVYFDSPAYTRDILAEVDAAETLFADTLQAFDGYVSRDKAEANEAEVERMREERDDAQDETERAKELVEKYRIAVEETEEGVRAELTAALDKQSTHDEQIARMQSKIDRAFARVEAFKKDVNRCELEARDANIARSEMQARMAVWGSDKTAAESSDHYRQLYTEQRAEIAEFRNALRDALLAVENRDGRGRKDRRDAVQQIRDLLEAKAKESR